MESNRLAARLALCLMVSVSMMLAAVPARATNPDARDRDIITGLHAAFQVAVKRNDATTMRRILDNRFVLVLGDGKRYTRAELLASAASGRTSYDKQDVDKGTRSVRVFGDTAVITARLWVKGTEDGMPFDRRVWFSDVYIRTPDGWRFVYCQTSLPLEDERRE